MFFDMKELEELLNDSDKASNDVCNNPSPDNCKKLEMITDMAISQLKKEILELKKKLGNA